MRLISWDGRRDVSYENCHLVINPKTFEIEAITGNTDFEPVMGIYSTEAKALKVMEMLQKQFLDYCCNYHSQSGVFYFPKDEEVEV